jgi:hypothetical protein
MAIIFASQDQQISTGFERATPNHGFFQKCPLILAPRKQQRKIFEQFFIFLQYFGATTLGQVEFLPILSLLKGSVV